MNAMRTFALPTNGETRHIRPWSCGPFPAGRSMIRSVNDGGAGGLVTVGSGQAEGSPKGGAPAAGATQRRKLPPTCAPRRQLRVCSDGAAPKASLKREGLDRPEQAFEPLGSGPMSFTQGTRQRPVLRDHDSDLNPSGVAKPAYSTERADLLKNCASRGGPPPSVERAVA